MKTTSSKIIFLEKKLAILDNDLFKLVIKDYFKIAIDELFNDKGGTNAQESLMALNKSYKDQLHSLRNIEKGKTKQIDLEDSIKEIKQSRQLTTYDRDGY